VEYADVFAPEFAADLDGRVAAFCKPFLGNRYLLGYSNGAMGVTRAAIQEPELFRGLIYLSPVTEDNLFSRPEFLSRSKDRRIVFLHGGRDARIPKEFVKGTVANLRQLGCDVDLKIYEDEDHFLLFSQPDAVLGDIGECMASSTRSR
jgi:predicted esterase